MDLFCDRCLWYVTTMLDGAKADDADRGEVVKKRSFTGDLSNFPILGELFGGVCITLSLIITILDSADNQARTKPTLPTRLTRKGAASSLTSFVT